MGAPVTTKRKEFEGQKGQEAELSKLALSSGIKAQSRAEIKENIDDLTLHIQRTKILLMTVLYRGHLKEEYNQHFDNEKCKLKENAPVHLKEFDRLQDFFMGCEHSSDQHSYISLKILKFSKAGIIPESLSNLKKTGREDAIFMEKLFASMRWDEPVSEEMFSRIKYVLDKITEFQKNVSEIKNERALSSIKKEFRSAKLKWRELLKEVALCVESANFLSPSIDSSLEPQCSPLQIPRETGSNYERFRLPGVEEVVRKLNRTLTGLPNSRGSDPHSDFLFSSGLFAFSSVLRASHFQSLKSPYSLVHIPPSNAVAYGENTYFELETDIIRHNRATGGELITVDPSDPIETLRAVIKAQAYALVLAPVANYHSLKLCDIERILELINTREFKKLWIESAVTRCKSLGVFEELKENVKNRPSLFPKFEKCEPKNPSDEDVIHTIGTPNLVVIIDNSTSSTLSTWHQKNEINLPEFVHLVTIESLVKMVGGGLELSGGGFVHYAKSSGRYFNDQIEEEQLRTGSGIPTTTLNRLALLPCRDQLDSRAERMSRNALLLSELLEEQVNDSTFLKRVSYPFLSSQPDLELAKKALKAGGSLLWLPLDPEFFSTYRDKNEYPFKDFHKPPESYPYVQDRADLVSEAFITLAIENARKYEVPLINGTSFGFDLTRITTYSSKHTISNSWEVTVSDIRISTGIDSIDDAYNLAAVLRDTIEVFEDAISKGNLYALSNDLCKNKKA